MIKYLPPFIQDKIKAYAPQYAHLKFENRELFVEWFRATTKMQIDLIDEGQDLIRFYIAENGEVIDTEIQALGNIYNGALLLDDPELISIGDDIALWLPKFEEVSIIKYPVKQIIR